MTVYRIFIDISGHDHHNLVKEYYFNDERMARIAFNNFDRLLFELNLHDLIIFYRINLYTEEWNEDKENVLFKRS